MKIIVFPRIPYNKQLKKVINICGLIFFCTCLIYGVIRTIEIYSFMVPRDLRNRIVGARLYEDHKDPYRYFWKAGEPMRYYDSYTKAQDDGHVASWEPNAVTASPFYLALISPVADLNQKDLTLIFSFLFWVSIITQLYPLFKYTDKSNTGIALGVMAPIFVSMQWEMHITTNQNYTFNSLLILFSILALLKKKTLLSAVFFTILILYKFNSALILVPLFFFNNKAFRRFFTVTGTLLSLYILWVLIHPFERMVYKSYFASIDKNYLYRLDFSSDYANNLNNFHPYRLANEGYPPEGASADPGRHKGFKAVLPFNSALIFKSRFKRLPTVHEFKMLLNTSLLISMMFFALIKWKCRHLQPIHYIFMGLLLYFLTDFLLPMEFYYFRIQWMAVGILMIIFRSQIKKSAIICYFISLLTSYYLFIYMNTWLELKLLPWFFFLLSVIIAVFPKNFHYAARTRNTGTGRNPDTMASRA